MNDVMLDLETMSTLPNAAIVAIGAVAFDLRKSELGNVFYSRVSLNSAIESDGHMDPDTVKWWLRQNDKARAEISQDGPTLEEALSGFKAWLEDNTDTNTVRIWGNGAAFDNVILASAYRSIAMDPPWRFWNDRCYRTIKAMDPTVKSPKIGVSHHALDDARRQAQHMLMIFNGDRTRGL